ncbi:unnamed protein product [Prorocentrum cordatum]|uniref:Uncharacterized protein n=1 Tax=Prorocentrum cordatum TaxID=2364126 RepID=A0ABN9XXZ3_9DINO|nr:unnamed protein product [Polarella glacialis]
MSAEDELLGTARPVPLPTKDTPPGAGGGARDRAAILRAGGGGAARAGTARARPRAGAGCCRGAAPERGRGRSSELPPTTAGRRAGRRGGALELDLRRGAVPVRSPLAERCAQERGGALERGTPGSS